MVCLVIELRTLGVLDLKGPDERAARVVLAQPKRLALLAHLAVSSHRRHPRRDSVVALFWPALDAEHARGALRQALRFLRRALGEGVLNGRSEEELGFQDAALWCDAVAFEEAIATDRLAEALDLYRGDFLDGLFVSGVSPEFERWLDGERARLRRLAAEAARTLAERTEAAGGHAAGVTGWERALALAPDDETVLRRLIALLDRLGDRARAVSAYEEFARRLAEDFETEPAVETKQLIEAVRARESRGPEPLPEIPARTPAVSVESGGARPVVSASGTFRRGRVGIVALAAVGALALGATRFFSRPDSGAAPDPRLLAGAACPDGSPLPCRGLPGPAPTSVAVLYFDDLSRDTADAYLADGLTDEIISRLGQLERLVVKSRTAVRRYRGVSAEPAALGRVLGVAYFVNGAVRRSRNRVRVTVELLRASSGDRLWGERYDRTDADLLAIEEEIAAAVATGISGRLLPAERVSLAERPTRDPPAYDHFLRGNFFLAQRTQQAVVRAINEYDAAARRDPDFTQASARIAYAYALFPFWGWRYGGLPHDSLLARGFALSERAVRRDSTLADAWMAQGLVLAFQGPRTIEAGLKAFQRAIALDEQNAEAIHQYGAVMEWLGDDSTAANLYQRALALEPERPVTLANLGDLYFRRRRYREAVRWMDSALIMQPGFTGGLERRSLFRLYAGDTAGARLDAETALRIGAGATGAAEAALAMVEAREGDTAGAQARVARLMNELPGSGSLTASVELRFLTRALVVAGHPELALEVLDRVHPRGGHFWLDLQSPVFDAIRGDPRFRRLAGEWRVRRRG